MKEMEMREEGGEKEMKERERIQKSKPKSIFAEMNLEICLNKIKIYIFFNLNFIEIGKNILNEKICDNI